MDNMRLYFDTEFTGLHQYTTLISIGIVNDNDEFFYAEFTDYNKSQVDNWIKENVINNLVLQNFNKNSLNVLDKNYQIKGDSKYIKNLLIDWLQLINPNKDIIEIWSDCLSYDWVLFSQLFGHAFNIPKQIYYIPFDLCTAFKLKGIDPDINREEFINIENDKLILKLKHNSLWDARIIKKCIEKLNI